jgi:hypothetical protein
LQGDNDKGKSEGDGRGSDCPGAVRRMLIVFIFLLFIQEKEL